MAQTALRLEVLGGVDLRRQDDSRIRSLLAQPKRLALLVYLAMEGRRGFVSRERIMAVFWPESDTARARQSLRNALYTVRQSTGDEIVVSQGTTDVGVSERLLSVDAWAFEDAVAAGRFTDAVPLYRGPFLDGFHLEGCPEWDDWIEGRRSSLKRSALTALREAARIQEAAGDLDGARVSLLRAQEILPEDESLLRERLLLLARHGNRAMAVVEAQRWTEALRSSLGVDPSAETLDLIAGLDVHDSRLDQEPKPVPGPPSGAPAPPPPSASPSPPVRSAGVGDRSGKGIRYLAVAVVAAVLLLSWIWASRPLRLPAADAGVIVAQFDGEGMSMSPAAGFALGALTARRLDSGGGGLVLTPDDLGTAGLDGVERRLVTGRLREVEGGLTAEVELTTTARPDEVLVRARASVDRFDLESLAVRLVAELTAVSGQRLGPGTTVPAMSNVPAAILPYFEGEMLAMAGRRREAAAAYERAVTLDSTFAMANFRLSIQREALGLREEALQASDRAVALASRMTDAERQLVDAWRVYQWGVVEQALPLFEALVAARGPDPDAWRTLAEIRFHWGPQLGVPRAAADSAFRTVLAIAPNDADALLHHLRLVSPHAAPEDIDSIVEGLDSMAASDDVLAEAHALRALSRGRPMSPEAVAWATGPAFNFESRRLSQLAASAPDPWVVAEFTRSLPPTEDPRRRALRRLLVAQLAAGSGRMAEARSELAALARWHPDRALEYRVFLELASPVRSSPDTLALLRERLRQVPPAAGHLMVDVAEPGIYRPRALVLEAMLTRALGEAIDDADLDRRGRAGPWRFDPDYADLIKLERVAADEGVERFLGEIGPGRPEWHRGRPDPLSYLAGLSRWSRVQSLLVLGRADEALRWLQTFPDVGGYDLVYVAEASLLRGRVLEGLGRRGEAAAAYRRALRLWSGADPEFGGLVDEARDGLERLGDDTET